VGLEHDPQLLHTGDVLGRSVAEPRNASGLSPLVTFRASSVEPIRLGKVPSKPREGVAKHSTVDFWNIGVVAQASGDLKYA